MYKILIAEDEQIERSALRLILNRSFDNIELLPDAKTGLEAVKHCRQYMPDILLLDISMPKLYGFEALTEIKKFHPNIHTIIITAHQAFSFAQEAMKLGVAEYLLKPVSPNVLVQSITSIMEKLEAAKRPMGVMVNQTERIEVILSYISENYLKSDFSLESAAEAAHLSKQYFSKYFKKKMGHSFSTYVSDMKIQLAQKLLLETDSPIYEIANELNFSDVAYFCKKFLRNVGDTPLQYRKKNTPRNPMAKQ